MKKQLLFFVLLPLLLGGFIYLAARPTTLAFVNYPSLIWTKSLPNWVVFNLPDGLWSYSLLSFTLILWQNDDSLNAKFWILTAFSLGVLLEIGQYFHFISGTFDWLDVLVYLLLNLISFAQFNSKKNEK
jgi:hypothetical protein